IAEARSSKITEINEMEITEKDIVEAGPEIIEMEITEKDIVEAGSSKIAEIIEMKITEKEEWKKIEIPEILAEICFHLDLKSLLAFSLVDKNTYQFIVSHYNDN
ncbi:13658_t:CDS:1, partial [Gigaspora margarita]